MVGVTISHYKITDKLGEGGMGMVYKAEDTELDRPVALKFLAPHLLRDEEGQKRFRREAKAAAALDHPNICTVYEIGQAEDQHFISMAFLEGRTLSKKIADGPLKLPEALSIAMQMAEGLEAAHEKGIVHRDIKPDNVMLMKGSRGLVKLMDFGLAQLAQSSKLTREGTTLGTPIYMSPEQALGESTDKRADVWALGIVLYEMVAGRPPFQGEVDQAVIYSIANEPHEPLTAVRTGVPKELERIVDKCLTKEADERYQHVTDLLVDLQACRRSLAAKPGATPAPIPVSRTALFVGLTAFVVVGLGLGWWFTRSPGPGPVPQYTLRQVTRDTGYTAHPTLSPDGRLLAYASDRSEDGNLDIWVQQLSGGGEPMHLTHNEADDYWPSFSPDGTRIVFNSNRDPRGIYVIPALGGNPVRIAGPAPEGLDTVRPRFSRDGQSVSYSRGRLDADYHHFSQIEIVPARGGVPRVLEMELPVALDPIWSPDGQRILFVGSREPGGISRTIEYDWWIVPVSGGEPLALGVRTLFARLGIRSRGLETVGTRTDIPLPRDWLADGRVIFEGSIAGSAPNLWQLPISADDGSVQSEPQRLTSGTGETHPSAADNGLVAFVAADLNWDIWSLPLDANRAEVLGEPERLVSGLSDEQYPTIPSDHQKLVYVSDRAGNFDMWLRDIATGEDTPLTISPEPEERGAVSPDGSKVAFARMENGNRSLYVTDITRGEAKRLVEGIGNIFDWHPGGRRILYYTPPPIRFKTVDFETGGQADLHLTHPDHLPSTPRFSPDGNWIAFNLSVQPHWPMFIARVEDSQPAPHTEWINIAEDEVNSHPWWSPDGNTLYYRSRRDGFHCLWAQTLDPATKKPRDLLRALQHFHGRVKTVNVGGGAFGYAMTNDRLYLPLSEPKANVWLAEPQATE